MTLPFFEAPLDVELGINLDGSFAAKLAGENGLLTLVKTGILELQVEPGLRPDGRYLYCPVERQDQAPGSWPRLAESFDVRGCRLTRNVKLEGGWLDLRDGYSLDFHGFKVEISKMGFGKNEDGSKWIGFSGALNLVDGLAAGASVEGLKVTCEDGSQDPRSRWKGSASSCSCPTRFPSRGGWLPRVRGR